MPKDLEKEVENLDDIFREQLTTYQQASAYVADGLKHFGMQDWQQIGNFREVCDLRIKHISGDYYRATSYESMRIINTRVTDVLNVIIPVKEFMEYVIKRCEDEKEKSGEETVVTCMISIVLMKELEVEEIPITEFIPDLHIMQRGLKYGDEEVIKAPEETDLLLNENHTKRNDYETPQPRRRGNRFFSCFFPS